MTQCSRPIVHTHTRYLNLILLTISMSSANSLYIQFIFQLALQLITEYGISDKECIRIATSLLHHTSRHNNMIDLTSAMKFVRREEDKDIFCINLDNNPNADIINICQDHSKHNIVISRRHYKHLTVWCELFAICSFSF